MSLEWVVFGCPDCRLMDADRLLRNVGWCLLLERQVDLSEQKADKECPLRKGSVKIVLEEEEK